MRRRRRGQISSASSTPSSVREKCVRRLAAAFRHAGLPFAAVPLREIPHRYIPHRQDHPFPGGAAEPVFDVNVLCLNAEHLVAYAETTGREVLADRYTVGVWFWETDTFRRSLLPALDYVDEVWVASEFVASAIAPETWKPVLTFPLPVREPEVVPVSRGEFGVAETAFVFTFAFDFFSTIERKNPDALIEAFVRRFEPGVWRASAHQNDQWRQACRGVGRACCGRGPPPRRLDP